MKRKRTIPERLLAFFLAVLVVLGLVVSPVSDVKNVFAAEGDYTVTVTAPAGGVYYPGETYSTPFTAKIIKTEDSSEVSETVTWSCSANATISPDGKLTVNSGVVADTPVTVTATYTGTDGFMYTGSVNVSVSTRASHTVSGTVKDTFDTSGINGANVVFTPNVGNTVNAVTDSNGAYTVQLLEGLTYTISVSDGNYSTVSDSITVDTTDVTGKNFTMTTNKTLSIGGADSVDCEGSTILSINNDWPEAWTVSWTVDGVPAGIGRSISVAGKKNTSQITVTASSHGVTSAAKTLTVNTVAVSADNFKIVDGEDNVVDTTNPVYTGDDMLASIQYKTSATSAITEGTVKFDLYKVVGETETLLGSSTDIELSESSRATWLFKEYVKSSGQYRVKAHYSGTSNYQEKEDVTEFVVTGKAGQSITLDSTNTNFPYQASAEKQSLNFEAVVAADADTTISDKIAQIKNVAYWSVSDSANILDTMEVTVESVVTEGELYKVSGKISFGTKETGTTSISLSYNDSLDSNTFIYTTALGSQNIEVLPKELTITNITFQADRIYDGTKNVKLNSVSLGGIVNNDNVYVITGDEKTYTLKDSNVTAGGVSLNVDSENGGTVLELTGTNKNNYTLSLTNIENFKCNIIPATIGVNLTGVRIEKDYYTENPDIKALAKENAAAVFSGFVSTDDSGVLLNAIKNSYMPEFTTTAVKESGVGQYVVKASNPSGAKPEELKNYQFNLNGTVVGKLVINRKSVADDDFSISPIDMSMNGSKSNIWVKKGTTNVNPIIPNDGSGYDAVVYCEQDESSKTLDFTQDGSGNFYFMLMNTSNGTTSYVKKIDFTTDSHTSTSVTVTANSNSDSPSTFNQILSVLTLGIFGNTTNTSATVSGSDDQSGVKSVQYVKKTYESMQGKSEDEIRTILDSESSWLGDADVSAKTVSFDEGRQILFVRTIDNVGNIQYAGSNGIIIDSQKSNWVKAEIKNSRANNVYNEDVTVSYEVTDLIAGNDSFSGVKEIRYQAYLNGVAQTATGWTGTFTRDYVTTESTADALKNNDAAMKFAGEFTIPTAGVVSTEANAINHVTVTITAVDYAGNTSDNTDIAFDYDITKPFIDVNFDGDAKNDKYFNADRTVTVKVTDAYFKRNGYGEATFAGTDLATPVDGYESGWKDLGNYTYEMKYCYSVDADHTFDVSITDAAGNLSKMGDEGNTPNPVPNNYRNFTVDQTAPEVTLVKYYMYVGENKTEITEEIAMKQRFYGNAKIYAEYTLVEHNFEERMVASEYVGGLDLDIKAVNSKDNNVIVDTPSAWTTNVDEHVLRVDFNTDANYTFDMNYTDKAGNELKVDYSADYFTVDTVVPSGQIKLSNYPNAWSAIVAQLSFGIFSKKSETATIINESDETAGVKNISILKSHDEMTKSALDKAYTDGKWTYDRSMTMGPNQQAIVYGRIEDKSGNYYYVSTNGFVLDDQIDKPQIDIVTPQPLNHIYNSNVNVKIKVVDPDPRGNHDYAGLKSVYYEVRNNGTVTQSGNLNVVAGDTRQKSVEDVITVLAEKNNSNHVQVYVKATDNADNMSEQTLNLKIDITKPKVAVTFNNNNPLNNKYYKDTRTATITITERNFDPNNVQINVTNTGGTKAGISGWSHSAGAGESDSATHTATITFAADGDYTFTVDCTDLAMNKAENPYKSDEFTIDKTTPTISVSYDNNSAQNGNYYKAARTATITITEHNFRAGDVKVTTTASNGGAPGVSGWSTSGDRHTATVRFGSDADYTFDISYIDLAGNAAADYAQDKFTVDLTKPSLEITGVQNKSANKGTVAPIITISDTNFISNGVSLTLTGANKGKVNTSNMISTAGTPNGQILTFQNFGSGMDDIYTLTAKAVDKAGNDISKSITFSVNRDGSTYVINDATKKLLEKGFTNNPQDIVIQEINVDTLEFVELSYSKDGQIVKLKEGTDFKVDEEGGEGQWKKYTYTVFADCFDEEGEYSINISSTDRAENVNNNKVQAMNVEFVVDKTSPVMAVSNLENRGRYKENSHEYTLNVKDNTSLVSVAIYLDDELFKNYELIDGKLVNVDDPSDILEMDNGKVYLTVDSKNSYQKIKLVSTDAAGNVSETEDYNVLVTANNWVQFYMNKPLFFGSIAGVFVLVGGGSFIFFRRKKLKLRS